MVKKNGTSHTHSSHTHAAHPGDASTPTTESTVEAAPPHAAAAPPAPPLPKPAPPSSISDAASAAVQLIIQAQSSLPLEDGLVEKARKSALGLQHVSTEALAESASILETVGSRFPTFDAKEARDAVTYEQSMGEVVSRASALIGRVQASILQRRSKAADQTLALYAVLKGQSRVDGSLRDSVRRLTPLLNTRTNPHQTKKQRTRAKEKKASPTAPPAAPVAVGTAAPEPSPAPTTTTGSAAVAGPVPGPQTTPATNGASAPPAVKSS